MKLLSLVVLLAIPLACSANEYKFDFGTIEGGACSKIDTEAGTSASSGSARDSSGSARDSSGSARDSSSSARDSSGSARDSSSSARDSSSSARDSSGSARNSSGSTRSAREQTFSRKLTRLIATVVAQPDSDEVAQVVNACGAKAEKELKKTRSPQNMGAFSDLFEEYMSNCVARVNSDIKVQYATVEYQEKCEK
jgi:hypothetical protein